ncbi:helix-turn-helix domain-containing protein [Sulfurimonas sp. SWIR-19]|uniref:helix-turn-helix domain-containing protein n=1 Tax=Sulfurimonas sp. SWIR-19 TaxID=2878390 RepID=UPI001CF116A5|nr:helix-turn-helix transcriptional regulator [Sulfurimonas sp. SWIR-19]UCN01321.1 helix-turn-helix domain-containing protein [Sulfurimonas sp. SWIR-19]
MNLLELGTKVKELRKEKGITQEALAKQVKISRATLSKLENGNIAQVSIVTLSAILNRLGYELDIKPSNPFSL